jgi:26S proteasome regulatory subunit (ATPase 3-interacting protein)
MAIRRAANGSSGPYKSASLSSVLPTKSLYVPLAHTRAPQDPSDAATPDELATIDSAISSLRASLPVLKTRFRLASTKLSALAAAPTSSELSRTVERLRAEIEEKRARLDGLRSGDARPVTREEVQRAEQEYGYWAGRRRARVRAFENLEELFLAGMEREELWERAGIEGDVE